MSEKLTKERCNKCQNSTNHEVLSMHKNEWAEEFFDDRGAIEYVIDFAERYVILKCAGCGEIQFLRSSYCSEMSEYGWHSISYPPRIARKKLTFPRV